MYREKYIESLSEAVLRIVSQLHFIFEQKTFFLTKNYMEIIHFPQPLQFLENILHVSFTICLILLCNFTWPRLSLPQVTHKVSYFRIFLNINAPILRTIFVCKTKLNFVTFKTIQNS